MICNVKRSQLDGVIKCPPSKSYTHRAIFLASLAEGKSTIYNPLLSNDTRATISACEKFGAHIENNDERLEINGTHEIKAANIDVANSGTSMRIAAAIASLAKGTSILSGDESLSKRPMGSLLKALYLLGAQIDSNDGMPPVTITGTIKGGRVEIPGNVSSQYVSALLIAGGATSEGIMVDIEDSLVSKDYVGYTIETMKRFGAKVDTTDSGYSCIGQKYRAAEFTVPYDMSILALLVAAKVLVGEKMKIDTDANIPDGPLESSHVAEICSMAGVNLRFENSTCHTEYDVNPKERVVDLTDQPDLLPAIAVLALKNKGKTTITGIGHTKYKETDRIAVITEELAKTGVTINSTDESMSLERTGELKPTKFDSRGDHRLFMAFCIASMYIGDCSITNPESVAVSYPNFIKDMQALGCKISLS